MADGVSDGVASVGLPRMPPRPAMPFPDAQNAGCFCALASMARMSAGLDVNRPACPVGSHAGKTMGPHELDWASIHDELLPAKPMASMYCWVLAGPSPAVIVVWMATSRHSRQAP